MLSRGLLSSCRGVTAQLGLGGLSEQIEQHSVSPARQYDHIDDRSYKLLTTFIFLDRLLFWRSIEKVRQDTSSSAMNEHKQY